MDCVRYLETLSPEDLESLRRQLELPPRPGRKIFVLPVEPPKILYVSDHALRGPGRLGPAADGPPLARPCFHPAAPQE